MDINRLHEIVGDATKSYRKGKAIAEREEGGIKVTEVYLMPPVEYDSPELRTIDVHFMEVGVNKKKAEKHRAELQAILEDWPEVGGLQKGPSYIEVGGIVDSQQVALQLFALGEALGFWKVLTPQRIGFTGAEADELAGLGFVMISGFNRPKAE